MSGEKTTPPACGCRRCLRERDARDAQGWPILLGTMVVCLRCGDKRCPAAFDHRSPCANPPS